MKPEALNPEFNIDMLEPGKDFLEGYRALSFNHQFSNGLRLNAQEESKGWVVVPNRYLDEDCEIPYEWERAVPQIKILDSKGRVVYDFATLLPKDYEFVVPHSFDKYDIQRKKFRVGWLADNEAKHIFVSDWQRPEEIFALLHEIGHAAIADDPRDQKIDPKEFFEYIKTGPSPFDVEHRRKDFAKDPEAKETALRSMRAFAFSERNASAWALRAMRKISQEIGIDLIHESGLDAKKLRKFITDALISHKKSLSKGYLGQPLNENDKAELDKVIDQLAREFKV